MTEFDRDRRWRTTSLVDLAEPERSRKVIFDLSINDAYGDPGRPMTTTRPDGQTTFLQDGDAIYLVGEGASPEGSRPFLDRMDLKTGRRSRLFHCPPRVYERPLGFVGESRDKVVIEHESKDEPPNEFTIDLASGERTRLTDYRDPAPRLSSARKELIAYKRADGVPLSGTLYLPADYKEGTRLPLIVWAYPREYNDACDGRAGADIALSLPHDPGPVRAVLRPPWLRPAGQRDDAGRGRPRDDERHLCRADLGGGTGGDRDARQEGRDRSSAASAWAGTATARS